MGFTPGGKRFVKVGGGWGLPEIVAVVDLATRREKIIHRFEEADADADPRKITLGLPAVQALRPSLRQVNKGIVFQGLRAKISKRGRVLKLEVQSRCWTFTLGAVTVSHSEDLPSRLRQAHWEPRGRAVIFEVTTRFTTTLFGFALSAAHFRCRPMPRPSAGSHRGRSTRR